MKPLLPLLALLACASAEEPAAEAFFIDPAGGSERVWITAATGDTIRYRKQEVGGDTAESPRSGISSIYLLEPPVLTEAIELFQARQYTAAREKFVAIRRTYQALRPLPDNPAALAGYLELECLRKTGDLAALAMALETFDASGLTRRDHLRQLDLYPLWDAVRRKDWPRVEELVGERSRPRLPGGQRAQVDYCLGLAREAQGRPLEAIDAYQSAITAGGCASEDLVRDAALRVMRLHRSDPGVQAAMKRWGTPDENLQLPGHRRLVEAAAMADLFELSLGTGTPLPAEEKVLLKFRAKR
jgi:hypothetical protein